MSAEREWTGVPCDDPAELRGLPYDEPEPVDLWDEMSPAQRAGATLRSLR